MPIDFPNSPSVGNTYPYGNSIWEWTGSSWELYGSLLPLPTDFTSIENTFTQRQNFTKGISSAGGTFGSRVNFLNGVGITGDILIHGATLGSRDGIAPKYLARAWVNFNGTVTSGDYRRANGNVSSIGDNGIGLYTINFTVPMVDANYSVCLTGKPPTTGVMNTCIRPGTYTTAVTTAAVQISTYVPATAPTDSDLVSVIVFR